VRVEIQEKFVKHETAERIIKAAESLAGRTKDNNNDDDHYRFEVENQDGTKLRMDPEDNKNLVLAMSLHEKGVKMMEKGEHNIGSKFLLEADSAFLRVKDEGLLAKIDNYARLCLDITWCLLKSKNFEELSAHSWRLDKAHEILKLAYGQNNERLIELRGGCTPDLIIYVRLFLLQAIVTYHAGDVRKAKNFLGLSEQKLSQMTITEDDMMELLQMGFTFRESRVGLRACNRNSHEAIQWLLLRREKEQERQIQEKEKRNQKRKQRNFGKTANGHWVNLQLLSVLVSQGFEEVLAAEALKQADNDEEKTYLLLVNNIDLLRIAVEKAKPPFIPSEEDMQVIMSMGFTQGQVYGTLKLTNGDMDAAVEKLLSFQGVDELPPPPPDFTVPVDANALVPPPEDATDPVEDLTKMEAEEHEKQLLQNAEYDLIGSHEADELQAYDIDLTEETDLFNHYKALILSTK